MCQSILPFASGGPEHCGRPSRASSCAAKDGRREGGGDGFRTRGDCSCVLRAVERNDFETLGRLVSDAYIWIDHTTDIVATTPEELLAAQDEDSVWSDREFVIDRAMETPEGVLVAQMTVAQTLIG
jgi:hypothetical protein